MSDIRDSRFANWDDATRRDPVTYWKLGRAYCPACLTVKVYVARVDVEDLKCLCGERCVPASGDEAK